jgi:hypothetical protein
MHASHEVWAVVAAMAVGGATACSSEADFTTKLVNPLTAKATDDVAPPETPYDEALGYGSELYGSENHSTDRFRFDIAAFASDAEREAADVLYPSHAALLDAKPKAIPSVQTVGTYLKQLDDTIYAGVERIAQDGLAPTVTPKRAILEGAVDYLAAHRSAAADAALAFAGAALELGGAAADVPLELDTQVAAIKSEFLDTPSAKPIGFYTWSNELRAIWQQDRLLQEPLDNDVACALAEAVAADGDRRQRYVDLVTLYTRLTNPLHSSLAPMLDVAGTAACAGTERLAFLSSSRSPEVELFTSLYPEGVPANADLMQDLIDAIRDGTVDLTPAPGDGWYAHQVFALETLLVTDHAEERAKIAFMARYKKRLQEAFETMLTQTRETHVKQADQVTTTAVAPPPYPHFRLEPLATVYARQARSYLFLEGALEAVLGADVLDQGFAVGVAGPLTETLRTRIRRARDLAFGLYALACQDIGLAPKLDQVDDPTLAEAWTSLAYAAEQWILSLADDPIAAADVRVIIPIADLGDGHWRYWAVVGVRITLAGYSYIEGMSVAPPALEDEARVPLPTEQFIEVTSSDTPLTRDEFRALCDERGTVGAIRAALEAR